MRTLRLIPLLLLCSCAQPQRPFQFSVPPPAEDPIATLVRALAQSGLTPGVVDGGAGVVQTRWENTGFLYGQIQQQSATIWRRYTVTLTAGPQQTNVAVRADVQRCAQGAMSPDGVQVVGACDQALDGLVPQHQADLDRLGGQLQAAMQGAARPGVVPPPAPSPDVVPPPAPTVVPPPAPTVVPPPAPATR